MNRFQHQFSSTKRKLDKNNFTFEPVKTALFLNSFCSYIPNSFLKQITTNYKIKEKGIKNSEKIFSTRKMTIVFFDTRFNSMSQWILAKWSKQPRNKSINLIISLDISLKFEVWWTIFSQNTTRLWHLQLS